MTRQARSYIIDFAAVFLIAAALIWPLFRARYLDVWASIESTFIADARFLRDHWPHPNWQPNWYCGTRTDYVYPPALRYGTAALARYVPRVMPARAYHLYVAFFYCFGIAGVYLLARALSGSRAAGWLAGLSVALISPSYLFIQSARIDSGPWMPYRLNVLLRYGEGPHMTALAWIPFALLFSFRAMQKWRPGSLALAAFCCAMVVSNNFYGATSLAILYPLLAWSVYITHLDKYVWLRAAAVGVLAYGLTAFWLVPSYLQITLSNMRFVSAEGNMWSRWVALGFIVGFLLLSDHLARGRTDRAYWTFLWGALAAFVINVLGNHFLDFRIIGEPARLVPELDAILLLFTAELFRRLWTYGRVVRAGIVIVLLAALSTTYWYVTGAHRLFARLSGPEQRVEYQLQDWVAKNLPGSRVLPAGSVRFWFNAWNDIPQMGGGSEQGLLNPKVVPPQWQIYLGSEAEMSIRWLQIFGVDATIVNGPKSQEVYHDFQYPNKFDGLLPVLYDNEKGDIIYRVPRRYAALPRVVDSARAAALPEIPGNGSLPELEAWYDVVERGPEAPTEMRWDGTDAFRVKATVAPGQALWIPITFDSNWRAYSANNDAVRIRQDKLGLMIVDVPPGSHELHFVFPTPMSNKVGRALTLLSLCAVAVLSWTARRRRESTV